MSYYYSDESAEPYALPNVWVAQFTAREVAEWDEDTVSEYMRKPAFKLASMNPSIREKMFDAIIEDQGIKGGWGWAYCFPGCLPDSYFRGPFDTEELALADMRAEQE